MKAGGSKQRQRTTLAANSFGPTWAPNGKHIAFYSDADGDFELYTMKPNGSHLKQLTHNTTFDGDPDYSPNAKQIAFSNGGGIVEMPAGGGGTHQLTTNQADSAPAFSPKGNQIAFERGVSGDEEIFTMKANGHKQRQRTTNSRDDIAPDWQPLHRHHHHH
jgi:Tol biopolymer transport system component